MLEENTQENYSRENPQSGRDWKPDQHSARGGIWTRVLEVEGKERYQYDLTWHHMIQLGSTILQCKVDVTELYLKDTGHYW